MKNSYQINKGTIIRINYIIIKEVWKIVKPQKEGVTFLWKYVGVCANTYTHIIDGMNCKLKKVTETLHFRTGVNEEYFNGKKIIKCGNLTDDMWCKYLKNVDDLKTGLESNKEKLRREIKEFRDQLKDTIRWLIKNEDELVNYGELFKLVYAFKTGIKWGGAMGRPLQNSLNAFNDLSIEELEKYNKSDLKKYEEELQKQLEKVKAVQIYKQEHTF